MTQTNLNLLSKKIFDLDLRILEERIAVLEKKLDPKNEMPQATRLFLWKCQDEWKATLANLKKTIESLP